MKNCAFLSPIFVLLQKKRKRTEGKNNSEKISGRKLYLITASLLSLATVKPNGLIKKMHRIQQF